MSEETLISKMSTPAGMTVKISHSHEIQEKINLTNMSTSRKRVEHYSFILESVKGDRKVRAIPKRLYVALRAFEIDPKFKGDL